MARLVETQPIVRGLAPQNITGGAVASDRISLKNSNNCRIILDVGTIAGGTSAVTLKQSQDVAGTGEKELAFTKVFQATTTDQYTEVAVVSNTFDLDTSDEIFFIEVDATDLDVNNDFTCIAVNLGTPGANDFQIAQYFELDGIGHKQVTPDSRIID